VRIAYLQDERQLARVSPEKLGIVRSEQRQPLTLQLGDPRKQVASENVAPIFDGSDYQVITPFGFEARTPGAHTQAPHYETVCRRYLLSLRAPPNGDVSTSIH